MAGTPESRQGFLEALGPWLGGQEVMEQQMLREKSKGDRSTSETWHQKVQATDLTQNCLSEIVSHSLHWTYDLQLSSTF